MASAMDAAVQNASQALDTTGIGKSTAEGLNLGMSLAQRRQELETQRQSMQFQQDQHEIQKSDWFHSQLKDIGTTSDPNLRKIKFDHFSEAYTQMNGQRINPAVAEYVKKVPSAPDALLAASTIWDTMNHPDLNVPGNQKLAYAKHIYSLWGGDPSEFFKEAAQAKGHADSMTSALQKALVSKGVSTPAAEAMTGKDSSQLEATMKANQPGAARIESTQTMAAQKDINKDPLLNSYKTRLDGAGRVYDLLDDADAGKIKTNRSFLGQLNKEVVRLETGSQTPGLGSEEKTEILSSKAQLEGFIEKFTGKPEDSVPPELLKQIRGTMDSMTGSYMKSIDDRYQTLAGGATDVQKPIVAAKYRADVGNYSKKFGRWGSGDKVAQASIVPPSPSNASAQPVKGPATPEWTPSQKALAKQQAIDAMKQINSTPDKSLVIRGQTFTEDTVRKDYENLRKLHGLEPL